MVENTTSGVKRLEIKKYANRRYYDATHSRHLTLEEIRSLVQQGYDIQVIDAKTSADITGQVLTQIILELDTPKLDSLPVPLLVRLIRMNDDLVKDFIEKYFNQALKSFFDYQRELEAQMRRTHGLPAALPNMAGWTNAMLGPFAAAFAGRTEEASSRPQPQPAPAKSVATAAEGEDLRELIRELQGQVQELKKSKSKKRPSPKSNQRNPRGQAARKA